MIATLLAWVALAVGPGGLPENPSLLSAEPFDYDSAAVDVLATRVTSLEGEMLSAETSLRADLQVHRQPSVYLGIAPWDADENMELTARLRTRTERLGQLLAGDR